MKISVAQAAKLMGVSPQFIRIGLQRDLLPIGKAVKFKKNWSYYISPTQFEAFTGIKMPCAATQGGGCESNQKGQG